MEKVFILNKIFDGSWNDIEGNISHEIIDFVLTDSGKHFVYNVPYGVCPNWIHVKNDAGFPDGTHEVEYLLLTSECHNKTFNIIYRIKLVRRMHNLNYARDWINDDKKKNAMGSIYEQEKVYYGGKCISDLVDNSTPLVTFEAECMEMPSEPIEISFSTYNYQRNKGYVKSDEAPDDYNLLEEQLNESKWLRVGLDPIASKKDNNYTSKTFLDLILKSRSEECYTNMLYSILREPGILPLFCKRFAPGLSFDEHNSFRVFREHSLIDGRMDVCADSGSQRIVIENKLESGLNGLKQDSISQLSTYYNWAKEADIPPICFVTAPDYRINLSHSNRHGQLGREIEKYDPQMVGKYILIPYSEICSFIDEIRDCISEEYEYYKYLDDIITAFRRHSYSSKASYYQSLLQDRIIN